MMGVLAIAFAIGFSLIMFQMVGMSSLFVNDSPDTGIEGEVKDSAESAENTSVDPEESTGFFSFVTGGYAALKTMLGVVAYLPATLESLGFPPAFAWLVGRGSQLVLALGSIQIVLQYSID